MGRKAGFSRIISLVAVGAMLAVQSPAQASPACTGCNLVEEHTLSTNLVGQAVWLENNRYIVTDVDMYAQKVFFTGADGNPYWSPAANLYSAGAHEERNRVATSVVGTAVALGILALLASGSRSSESSSYAPSSRSEDTTQYNMWAQKNRANGCSDNGVC